MTSPAANHAGKGRTGVLLSNLGTPAAPTAAALRPYLKEFLSDPRVVEAPRLLWWLLLRLAILPFRPRRSARLYASIWTAEGSPLLRATEGLAHTIARQLAAARQVDTPVAVGMRYGAPSLASGLRLLARNGCSRVLLLPLYPQYSATTSASTFDALSSELRRWRRVPELRTVLDYHDRADYIAALAASVRDAWHDHGRGDVLIMSFHGIPKSYAERGDPYPDQCAVTASLLAAALGLEERQWRLGFQSRFGPQEWVGPATDDVIAEQARHGVESLDVICPGFAVDCLETLEEIAVASRNVFIANGGRRFTYIPALNARSDHAELLARVCHDNLGGW